MNVLNDTELITHFKMVKEQALSYAYFIIIKKHIYLFFKVSEIKIFKIFKCSLKYLREFKKLKLYMELL